MKAGAGSDPQRFGGVTRQCQAPTARERLDQYRAARQLAPLNTKATRFELGAQYRMAWKSGFWPRLGGHLSVQ